MNVSCETCHGPGSAHVAWAEARKKQGLTGRDDSGMGLQVQGLRALDYGGFGVGDATAATARLANRPRQRAEIQSCAPCHSRRGPITDVPDVGKTYLDSYRPALLEDGLYYADGQIREEVYEYASFTQSKMYAAGVTCSDCHNAHSLKQRGTGNNVCGHCHLPLTYDTPAHHHHKQGTDAALCRNCHMRTTTYMVVDPRYDHSFRVPRVDYTQQYGIPNACTTPCHTNKSVAWANDAVVKWYGPTRTRGNDYVRRSTRRARGCPRRRARCATRRSTPGSRAWRGPRPSSCCAITPARPRSRPCRWAPPTRTRSCAPPRRGRSRSLPPARSRPHRPAAADRPGPPGARVGRDVARGHAARPHHRLRGGRPRARHA